MVGINNIVHVHELRYILVLFYGSNDI